MSYKILFIGEIVGKFGVFAARKGIKSLKKSHDIDFVIANANGATGGFGFGKNHALALKNAGVDVLTGGDYTFFKKDLVDFIPRASFILRPANYTPQTPGRGWSIYTSGDKRIGVVNILGPSGITRNHPSNPFTYIESIVEKIKKNCDIIFINFHSKTTAEKQLMFHVVNGKVDALVGSGSRSITADAVVSSKGTAFITDSGRSGSSDSPGGLEPKVEIDKLLTGIPKRSKEINSNLELQGLIITFNDDNVTEGVEVVKYSVKKVDNG